MRRGPIVDSWPPERVEMMIQLMKDPKNTSLEISKHLNLAFKNLPRLSRNAVVGKIRRYREKLKIAPRKKPRPHTRLNPQQEKTSVIPHNFVTNPSHITLGKPPPLKQSKICVSQRELTNTNTLVVTKPRTPDEMQPGMCVWPVAGDPTEADFRYCGRPVREDRQRANYCLEHDAKAHPPMKKRPH